MKMIKVIVTYRSLKLPSSTLFFFVPSVEALKANDVRVDGL